MGGGSRYKGRRSVGAATGVFRQHGKSAWADREGANLDNPPPTPRSLDDFLCRPKMAASGDSPADVHLDQSLSPSVHCSTALPLSLYRHAIPLPLPLPPPSTALCFASAPASTRPHQANTIALTPSPLLYYYGVLLPDMIPHACRLRFRHQPATESVGARVALRPGRWSGRGEAHDCLQVDVRNKVVLPYFQNPRRKPRLDSP